MGWLQDARAEQLAELSYAWDASDAAFAYGLQQLAAYAAAHGGSTVVPAPSDDDVAAWPGGAVLREWCRMQRRRKQHGTLRAGHVAQLEQLDFLWNKNEAIWQDWFNQLQAHAAANGGSTRVPTCSPLWPWAARQRKRHASGNLGAERAAQLRRLHFAWKLR
jgi:hypothetical protein